METNKFDVVLEGASEYWGN